MPGVVTRRAARVAGHRKAPARDYGYLGRMLTLYSYPALFGITDNNGYGLKVYAFLKLADVPFVHEHVFDPSAAPRAQLPYIVDGDHTVGDSDAIIGYVTNAYGVTLDAALSQAQRDVDLMVKRTLDDLYWVMSYSRWKDDRYYPAFRDAFIRQHPQLTVEDLDTSRAFNAQRYHFQGIGRYAPEEAYARGIADLEVLARLVPQGAFVHGARPTSIDAAIYGFIANIHFYPIDTPLKACLELHPALVAQCEAIHAAIAHQSS